MTPEDALTLLMQELQQMIDMTCKLTGLGYLEPKMKRLNEAREILATGIERLKAHTEAEDEKKAGES